MAESNSVLTDEILKSCAGRAGTYDKENSFFSEDFEQLKAAGYNFEFNELESALRHELS